MRNGDLLHRTGTALTSATAYEALREAGLADWNVRFEGLRTRESGLDVDSKRALVYDTPNGVKVMSTAGNRYEIVQTEEHAEFLDAMVDFSGGKYETARAFKGDKIVMLSIKLPDVINVAGTDRVDLYLNAINSFDGTTPFMVNLDPVRANCANQLNYYRNKAFRTFKIRHTKSIRGHVQLAREALGMLMTGVEQVQRESEILASLDLTNAAFERIVEDLYPVPKRKESGYEAKRERLTELFRSADTNANINGTAWAGFNAVVEYLNWDRPVKSKVNEMDRRAERVMVSNEHHNEMDRVFAAFAPTLLAA